MKNHDKIYRLQPGPNQIIIRGKCEETPSLLLIDTGASVSLVHTKLIAQIDRLSEILPTNIIIAGLDKVIVPTKGEIRLPLMFGNILVHHTFIVCNDLEHEFLIGMDILTKHKIVIDVPNKFICTSNGQEKFLQPPVSLKNRVKVRCMKTTIIPAHSAGHLMGKIPSHTKSNFEGVIDPYLKLAEEKGIVVIGTLSYTEKNSVPIHFINTMVIVISPCHFSPSVRHSRQQPSTTTNRAVLHGRSGERHNQTNNYIINHYIRVKEFPRGTRRTRMR